MAQRGSPSTKPKQKAPSVAVINSLKDLTKTAATSAPGHAVDLTLPDGTSYKLNPPNTTFKNRILIFIQNHDKISLVLIAVVLLIVLFLGNYLAFAKGVELTPQSLGELAKFIFEMIK